MMILFAMDVHILRKGFIQHEIYENFMDALWLFPCRETIIMKHAGFDFYRAKR